ncbi:SDR family NAD(P)-dependent oxidoreductase [Bacteroides sp. 519]|uniref:SDR family NAD(P)-dependent oxidoreductase n=1 Tax=Bacteroides sp. 519 TaxID=2302937 RepID=UPI0013D22FDB|nr:SDR family NAD(P)-dependent oxidoreductase [Bacteroides sp. 519]NDV57379.1 SDR family NAD(P)-dependent oxidoreductase [Bacteroides sp. 519]
MNRIIIIGATSGIGLEVAKLFRKQGWYVGIAGRRADRLEELKATDPQGYQTQQLDVTSPEAPDHLTQLIEKLGGMDIFFLSSGIGKQNPTLNSEIEFQTLETNVNGFTRMVLSAYHYFQQQGKGHIAVISSIAGTKGLGSAPSYSASKGFQNLYIESLEQLTRMQKIPITFTDIRPGFVRTELLNDNKNYPFMLLPEKVAQHIVKAVLHQKSYVTIDWKYCLLVFFWRFIPRRLWVRLPIRN